MDKNLRIYVAGHNGLVGSAIWKNLESKGFTNLIGFSSKDLDLTDRAKVFDYMSATKPDVVIDAAAKVGGILANNKYPADFLSHNLQIQVNLIDAANKYDVERFLFLGSSCIYPKFAPQPIEESALLTGALEPTNDAYAIAKIAGIYQVQSSRKQFGRKWISAMPTNLFGPGDNFHPENSHVLPALIRRFHEAKMNNLNQVSIWGSGKPRREFLFSEDLADACLFLLDNYDSDLPINVGTGKDLSISEIASLVAQTVGYEGIILQDTSKPDGTPRKVLDVSKLTNLGWSAQTEFSLGLSKTYNWFLENEEQLRQK